MKPHQPPRPVHPSVQVVGTEVVTHGWHVHRRMKYRLEGDASGATHVRDVFGRADRVAVLPYDPQSRRVLLIETFRAPVWFADQDAGVLFEACSGLVEAETPEQCAAREGLEELGVRLTEFLKIGSFFLCPTFSHERVHLYLSPYRVEQRVHAGGGIRSEGECLSVAEMTVARAMQLAMEGRVADAKTALLLMHLRCRGLQ